MAKLSPRRGNPASRVVETAAGYYLGTEWSQGALFVIFVLVLLLRPAGLFGKKAGDSQLVGGH